jgi:putative ABC transport system ATP-binding protein
MNTKTKSLNQPTSLMEVNNISHSFDYKLFSNINLQIKSNDTIAITGISGCGKSTFLNILSSLLKPNSGSIIYNDKNIYECKEDEITQIRRDDFGIIFQSHYLFRGFNAVENLSISSILNNQDIDYDLLKELKIDHIINQNIGELSGGQQQRLSIARVLIKKPKVIFADEPTGNLDKNTANDVMNVLYKYVQNNNAALVIVTHENEIANQCKHIYTFNNTNFEKIK